MEGLQLFEFQRNCVNELLEAILNGDSKEILVQAPTGSGKTIILLDMISEYNEMLNDVVFIWLTPGNAELEEQSKQKMDKFFPSESSKFLNDVISDEDASGLGKGFCIGHSYFCVPPRAGQSAQQWYESIIKYEISPLLDEYWWDDKSKAEDCKNRLLGR